MSDSQATITCGAEFYIARLKKQLKEGTRPQLYRQVGALDGMEIGPGLLSVMTAPPSIGKTAICMQMMNDVLKLETGLRIVVANAEMTFENLAIRELTRRTKINGNSIRFGELTADEMKLVNQHLLEMALKFDRVEVLEEPCNVVQLTRLKDGTPGWLIVDYLQLFALPDKEPRVAVNEVVKELRALAKLGWGVLAISAMKRNSKGNYDPKDLSLASFKESGEIEFNADAAYVLKDFGPVDKHKPYIRSVTLECVKNRNGPMVSFPLVFHRPRMEFTAPQGEQSESQFASDFPQFADNPFSETSF